MTHDFSHILLSLRKERKLTQKQAALELDISPALLSHYEKGIRECGLGFVVRAADFYHVSCDYLLGRTTDRSGMAPELVSPNSHGRLELAAHEDGRQKQMLQGVHILFGMLEECGHERLTQETVTALSVVLYALFRAICHTESKDALMGRSAVGGEGVTLTAISRSLSRVARLAQGQRMQDSKGVAADKRPALSEERLRRDYPFFVTSLTRLLDEAEEAIKSAE